MFDKIIEEIKKYFYDKKYEYSKKTETKIKLESITVVGNVNVTFWDTSTGWLEMAPMSISLNDIYDEESKSIDMNKLEERVKNSINDDGFGVQKFNKADIELYLDIIIDIPEFGIETSVQKHLGDVTVNL